MPYVNTLDLVTAAKGRGYAVPAINIVDPLTIKAVVEAADHEVVGGVDEELGDHRQHHPAAEREDPADQGQLEAEFEQARGRVVEVGQLHVQVSRGVVYAMRPACTSRARGYERCSSWVRMSCSSLPAHSGL